MMIAGPTLAQFTKTPRQMTGEASVVIFENFETGEYALRYFMIDEVTRLETEVFFGAQVPGTFKTGNIVTLEGSARADGFDVQNVILLDEGAAGTLPFNPEADVVAAPETRNVLTLLVDFNDAYMDGPGMNYGVTLQEARDRMFNEPKSVAGLYWNASLTTLTIPPDPDGDGTDDVFGPYQINDSYIGGDSAQCSPSTWVNLASAAWEAANPGKDINLYRHRSLIVPNYWDWGNRHCTWGGVAQVGCGSWCWAVSADPDSILHGVVIHELGHNFSFHHARTDTNNDGSTDSEYGDGSDMMGSSRSWMKFNAPHAEDKGWHDPVDYEIRTITSSVSAQNFDLIAMDEEFWDWPGLRAIKVERTANTDYYISYRRAAGEYNNVNSGYRNVLSVHYGYDGSTASYFVTTLAAGETLNEPHNNLSITATGEMVVNGPAGSTTVMGMEICQDFCSSIIAPSNLTANAISTGAIDLEWDDNSENEDGFHLEHSLDGNNWDPTPLTTQSGTTYTHGGLATASTHYYRVQAYTIDEVSGYSNVASETTDAIAPNADFTWTANYTEVSFIDASSDFDGSVVGWSWGFGDGNGSSAQDPVHTYASGDDYTVVLTVTDNHGATDFISQVVTVENPPFTDYQAIAESTAGGTVSGSYTDTFVNDGTAESIRERESGGKPNRRHSWLEHRWTFNIVGGDMATAYVNAWQDPSTDGDYFDFEFSTNGTSWSHGVNVPATSDPGTAQSFALPGVGTGTVYLRAVDTDRSQGNRSLDTVYVDELRIRVENATGEPPDGNPSNLSATAPTFDRVDLTWTDNITNETGFRIERRMLPDGSFEEKGQAGANAGNQAGYTDSNGLVGNTWYQYRVIAFNLVGESDPSLTFDVQTPAAPNILLSADGYKVKGRQTVDLSWTSDTSGNMTIYRDGDEVGAYVDPDGDGNGAYTDLIGNKGGGNYNYQVCDTGNPGACSNIVTVVF
jgi:PKD repeat protein